MPETGCDDEKGGGKGAKIWKYRRYVTPGGNPGEGDEGGASPGEIGKCWQEWLHFEL